MQQNTDNVFDQTRVSVIIPYSPEHTPTKMLEEAKKSVKDQSVSTDLIIIKDSEQRGPAWARNQGLTKADTRFVAFLDADDLWQSNKLARQIEKMVRTDSGLCVEGSERPTKKFILDVMMNGLESLTSSIVIDTEKVTIKFDEKLKNKEDHLFLVEAAQQGGVCLCSNLVKIRKHSSGISATTSAKKIVKHRNKFAEKCFDSVDWLIAYKNEYYSYHYFRNGRTWYYSEQYNKSLESFNKSLQFNLYLKTIPAGFLSLYGLVKKKNKIETLEIISNVLC